MRPPDHRRATSAAHDPDVPRDAPRTTTITARARLHDGEAARVFRVLVDALASPGRTYRMPRDLVGRTPMALVPLLAVGDIDVTVAVEPDRERWALAVATATGAATSASEDADWVAFLEAPTSRSIERLDPGSTYAPERGTRVSIAVDALVPLDGRHRAPAEATVVRLAGPGVPGHTELAVVGIGAGVFATLAAVNRGFPAGLDTWLLAADGSVAAIPRSSTIELR
jgi:alpha-D-ribose 1-methylphosphonate 5-triphosphate synthase subunit PhnH